MLTGVNDKHCPGFGASERQTQDLRAASSSFVRVPPISDQPQPFVAPNALVSTINLVDFAWDLLSATDRQRIFVDNPPRLDDFD